MRKVEELVLAYNKKAELFFFFFPFALLGFVNNRNTMQCNDLFVVKCLVEFYYNFAHVLTLYRNCTNNYNHLQQLHCTTINKKQLNLKVAH